MIATTMALLACAGPNTPAAQLIHDARAEFNQAIIDKDLDSIRQVLAPDVSLVTGTDSELIQSREAQLALWQGDFTKEDRLVYTRSPSCVKLSPLYAIALEAGTWRGERAAADDAFVAGEYSAKWRLTDKGWRIEAEIFMTTHCGGALCPTLTP